ncbi:MAG: hypothetical protein SGI83_05590 [Bacteroidota bacterium]|nr:hypothetical protein [Bacteroidota bacterium]
MRLQLLTRISLLAIIISSLFSCNEKEEFVTENIKDYLPLTTGKYIIYRLDSLVFTQFGRTIETHRYQQKDQVDGIFTDLAGRTSYRIQRYLRDSLGTGYWQPLSTYVITPLTDQIELQEDNLRFIKLHMPITNGFSWKGNRYIPTDAYSQKYNFSNDNEMELWDYYYDGLASPFSYRGYNYTNVLSVEEIDEAFNVPITSPTSYAAKSRAVEKYSKSIGLVYQEYELWEYQPNTGGSGGPYYTGFGIKKWMIDHN